MRVEGISKRSSIGRGMAAVAKEEAAHSASPRKGARNETSGRYTRTRLRTIISHRPIDPFIRNGIPELVG